MLFLGNLGSAETFQLYERLRKIAATIETDIVQDRDLDPVNFEYNKDIESSALNSEYYSTKNIYNFVGY